MHRNGDFKTVGKNVCRYTITFRQPLKGRREEWERERKM
jgi:hypothetical protein